MSIFNEQSPAGGDLFSIGIDEQGSYYLLQTAKWTKFLAIMGMVITGLLVISLVFVMAFGSAIMAGFASASPIAASVGWFSYMFILVIMMVLYVYPILCLYRFSNYTKTAVATKDSLLFQKALKEQRNMWRFLGIICLIVLAFYALIFVFGILGFMFR
jgi:hypothetical protein